MKAHFGAVQSNIIHTNMSNFLSLLQHTSHDLLKGTFTNYFNVIQQNRIILIPAESYLTLTLCNPNSSQDLRLMVRSVIKAAYFVSVGALRHWRSMYLHQERSLYNRHCHQLLKLLKDYQLSSWISEFCEPTLKGKTKEIIWKND